jgi:hypothetical protein
MKQTKYIFLNANTLNNKNLSVERKCKGVGGMENERMQQL